MLDVAVLIASVRDPSKTIKSINKAAMFCKYTHCIYVYAEKKPVVTDNVVHIPELEKCGSVAAYNALGKLTESEYIITVPDGICVDDNLFDLIDELKQIRANHNKFVISSIGQDNSPIAVHPRCSGLSDKVDMLRMPCFERRSFNEDFAGHVFNPHFLHHACDHWVAVYPFLMGHRRSENRKVLGHYCNKHVYNSSSDEDDLVILESLCRGFENNRSYIAVPQLE